MLAWTIYISFLGVLVLMLLPRDDARAARKVARLPALECGDLSPLSAGDLSPSNARRFGFVRGGLTAKREASVVLRAAGRGAALATGRQSGKGCDRSQHSKF